MSPNTPDERAFTRPYRRCIKTLFNQLEAMGIQRLYAHAVDGFLVKVHTSLIALACPLLNQQLQCRFGGITLLFTLTNSEYNWTPCGTGAVLVRKHYK